MKTPFFVLACLLCISVAHGLKCYICGGTEEACSKEKLEEDKATKLLDCSTDTCMRSWSDVDGTKTVANTCTTSASCELTKKACDDGSNDKVECKVACCDTDGCNAGSAVSISVFLMTMCSVLGVVLLK